MRNLFYIFIGGGLGSVMRFLVANYTQKLWNINTFPMGTFAVNIVGCFLIGILSAYFLKADNYLKFLLITGFWRVYHILYFFRGKYFALGERKLSYACSLYSFECDSRIWRCLFRV